MMPDPEYIRTAAMTEALFETIYLASPAKFRTRTFSDITKQMLENNAKTPEVVGHAVSLSVGVIFVNTGQVRLFGRDPQRIMHPIDMYLNADKLWDLLPNGRR